MKLEFLVEYSADLQRPTRNTGTGPFGMRGLAVVAGGSFEGPRLKGKIWAGGGDWWLRDPDGVTRLDVRVTFETGDGALIYVQYYGVSRPDGGRPIAQPGEISEYGDAYFMTAPRFETGDERYGWLNGLVCIAEGKRTAHGVAYRVYAVMND
ncbi:MAG: DUF3237 domain-containing protein [Chloroflexi bacterium]|nr:DUF3237 domain-containing protein [Chloroflexota bacterium]